MMNILRFLTPKKHTIYIYDHHTVRQVLEKLDHYGYSAIPIIDHDGHYIATITEGDLLRAIKHNFVLNLKQAQHLSIQSIKRKLVYDAVSANTNMEDLVNKVMNQNFVPVVDDRGVFIGIITRREIINYCYYHHENENAETMQNSIE